MSNARILGYAVGVLALAALIAATVLSASMAAGPTASRATYAAHAAAAPDMHSNIIASDVIAVPRNQPTAVD